MSADDSLEATQAKMREYQDNGVRLGWLIAPKNRFCEIYRQGQEKEVITSLNTLLGEDVLPGFVLDLQGIF